MMIYWNYLRYILRHKWYVFRECVKYGLWWRGVVHDWHKFLPVEFFPYAQSFYGEWKYNERPEWLVDAFDRAWLHHQHYGSHHWQHWLLREDSGNTKCLPMPHKCRAEMVADWHGAGLAINGKNNTKEWYLQNKEKILLHPATREWVESEIGLLVHKKP